MCESWLAAPVIYEVYAGLFIPSYAQEVLDEMYAKEENLVIPTI